jgi:hypothetical protein
MEQTKQRGFTLKLVCIIGLAICVAPHTGGGMAQHYAPAGKTPVAFAVGWHAPETVDDRHCHQPGQDTLDDHR